MIHISAWHGLHGWVVLNIKYLAATGWRFFICGFCFTVPIWLLFGFYSAVPLRFVCGFYSTVLIRVHYDFYSMVPIWFLCDFPDYIFLVISALLPTTLISLVSFPTHHLKKNLSLSSTTLTRLLRFSVHEIVHQSHTIHSSTTTVFGL